MKLSILLIMLFQTLWLFRNATRVKPRWIITNQLQWWLSVALDLYGPFPTEETLLTLVDCYSWFRFIEILKGKTSANIVSKLFKIFSVHGLLEILTSDNGGQFTMVLPIKLHS